jgi:signal transduction histidine kinase
MAAQALYLNRLLTSLSALVEIQQGKFEITPRSVDLVTLVHRVLERAMPSPWHTLEFSGSNAPLIVNGDEVWLEQALANIVENAIKYSPKGGLVRVTARRDGEHALVAVSDEGIGIPEAERGRLFERFYRGANMATMHISGLGIGLHLVDEIVRFHEGQIELVSVEGSGSEFSIRLPLRQCNQMETVTASIAAQ